MLKRIIVYLCGITILTFGIMLTVQSDIGASGYDAFTVGLASHLNMSVSIVIFVLSILMLLIVSIIRGKHFNAMPFLTSICMGIFLEMWLLVAQFLPQPGTVGEKVIWFIAGILCLCVGVALYLVPKFPPNPVDEVMVAMHEVKHINLGISKFIIDISFMGLAFLIGGPVGIGTIIITLVGGPLVNFFYQWFNQKIKID